MKDVNKDKECHHIECFFLLRQWIDVKGKNWYTMGDELSMRGKVNDECQDYLTSRTFYRVKENKFRAKQGFGTTIKKFSFLE